MINRKLFRKLADENRTTCGRRLIREKTVRQKYFDITGYDMSNYEYKKNANIVHSEDWKLRTVKDYKRR